MDGWMDNILQLQPSKELLALFCYFKRFSRYLLSVVCCFNWDKSEQCL